MKGGWHEARGYQQRASAMDRRETWGQDKTQKGRALLNEITALADSAQSGGFPTTGYILKMAASELARELDQEGQT